MTIVEHNNTKNRINILKDKVILKLDRELSQEDSLSIIEFSEKISNNIYKYFNGAIRGVFNNNKVILYAKIDGVRRAIFHVSNKTEFKIKHLKWFKEYINL